MRSRPVVVTALGIAQILAWGSSFYFPAVLAEPIVADTGWSLGWVVGGVSIGLLVAGLIAPRVGAIIERRGGRPVLAASSLLYAAGLAGIGLAPTLPVYLAAWVVLGAGMGTGLYDAVFAALGKLYGKEARTPITNLTLFGGFASTVCWPLSAFLGGDGRLARRLLRLCRSASRRLAAAADGGDAGLRRRCRRAAPGQRGSASAAGHAHAAARIPDIWVARPGADDCRRHRLDRGGASPDLPAGEGRDVRRGGDARHAVRPRPGRARASSSAFSANAIIRSGPWSYRAA
jgi:hypothetical protein